MDVSHVSKASEWVVVEVERVSDSTLESRERDCREAVSNLVLEFTGRTTFCSECSESLHDERRDSRGVVSKAGAGAKASGSAYGRAMIRNGVGGVGGLVGALVALVVVDFGCFFSP